MVTLHMQKCLKLPTGKQKPLNGRTEDTMATSNRTKGQPMTTEDTTLKTNNFEFI